MVAANYIKIADLPDYPSRTSKWERLKESCLAIPPGMAEEFFLENETQSVDALVTNLSALVRGSPFLRATKRGDQVFVMTTEMGKNGNG